MSQKSFIEVPQKIKGTYLENLFIREALKKKVRELNLPYCLVGEKFDVPRKYGHATYKIIGDYAEWKTHQDAQKVYFYIRPDGTFNLLYNELKYQEGGIPVQTVVITIMRLGGFEGPPQRPSLRELIEKKQV